MATAKRKDKLDGTDRWTSKGYGITAGSLTAAQKADIEKLNKELASKKAKKNTTKKR